MADQSKFTSKLRGSRILVIGGSSGIGYAVACAALEQGSAVSISSSNPGRIEKALASLTKAYPSAAPNRITGHTCDLSSESTLENNIVSLLDSVGPGINHIVFTAGDPITPTPIATATLESIRAVTTVRYTAPIFLAKHAPRYMARHDGGGGDSSIVLTTGVVAQKPIPGYSVMAGARGAVIALARNLAVDLKPTRVNVVCVAAVDTEAWERIDPEAKKAIFDALEPKTTTGRVARPEDVAEAYMYCLRDRNVTGAVVTSDGGNSLL